MASKYNARFHASYEMSHERTLLISHEICDDFHDATYGHTRNTDVTDTDTSPTTSLTHASRARKVVLMAASFYLMFCSSAIHISLGVIYVELIAYFDSPRSEAALVQSLFAGFSVGGGILFNNLVLKYEAGLIVMLSALIATISFCASAFAPSIQVVIVLIGVVAGLANSTSVLVPYIVVSWTFQERRKVALGALLVGSAAGNTLLPYITTELVKTVFWRNAVIIIGASLFLNCIPCGLVIYCSRHCFRKGDTIKLKNSKLVDRKCLTDAVFLVFLSSYVCLSAFIAVEAWFVVDLSVLKGFPVESGANLLVIMGLMLGLSRVLVLVLLGLAPNIKIEYHLIYIFLGLAASHIIISESTVYWALVLGMILRGFSSGLVYGLLPGVQIDMRGLELFPQTMSVSNFLGGLGFMAGGYIGGLIYDLTKSYSFVFFLSSGVNVYNAIAMVLIILMYKYRRSRNNGYETL